MLFLPNTHELDCINDGGQILGQIRFDIPKDEYVFVVAGESTVLSAQEESEIAMRIAGLAAGVYSMPMLDED